MKFSKFQSCNLQLIMFPKRYFASKSANKWLRFHQKKVEKHAKIQKNHGFLTDFFFVKNIFKISFWKRDYRFTPKTTQWVLLHDWNLDVKFWKFHAKFTEKRDVLEWLWSFKYFLRTRIPFLRAGSSQNFTVFIFLLAPFPFAFGALFIVAAPPVPVFLAHVEPASSRPCLFWKVMMPANWK